MDHRLLVYSLSVVAVCASLIQQSNALPEPPTVDRTMPRDVWAEFADDQHLTGCWQVHRSILLGWATGRIELDEGTITFQGPPFFSSFFDFGDADDAPVPELLASVRDDTRWWNASWKVHGDMFPRTHERIKTLAWTFGLQVRDSWEFARDVWRHELKKPSAKVVEESPRTVEVVLPIPPSECRRENAPRYILKPATDLANICKKDNQDPRCFLLNINSNWYKRPSFDMRTTRQ